MATIAKNIFTKNFPGIKFWSKELFLPILLLYYLFIFSVSNYTGAILLVKFLSSLLIFFFWNDLKEICRNIITQKIHVTLTIIFIYLLITVSYSANPGFGSVKLAAIVFSYIPLIFTAYLVFRQNSLTSLFIILLILVSSTGAVISLIIAPFDYSTTYSFSLLRWSHVVFGRIIGLSLLINVYLLLTGERGIRRNLLQISLQILSAGLFFSGARGAIFASLLSILALIVSVKSLFHNKLIILIQILISIILLVFLMPQKNRVSELEKVLFKNQIMDSSISDRIEAYKISLERWGKSPVTGIGLGGFNSFYKTSFPQRIVYPHNLLLEVLSELGIIGMILLLMLFLSLFINLWKIRHEFTILFLYPFGLALFSKDLASNPILFAFICVYLLRVNSERFVVHSI